MSPPQKTRATRSSLACLSCRSRHLKCDGKRPVCSRCTESDRQCHYARSRRGGLDRAALAEHRKRLTGADNTTTVTISDTDNWSPPDAVAVGAQGALDLTSQFIEANFDNGGGLLDGITIGNATPNVGSPGSATSLHVEMTNIEKDSLVHSYYKNFHRFHPLLLPRRHMTRYYQTQIAS